VYEWAWHHNRLLHEGYILRYNKEIDILFMFDNAMKGNVRNERMITETLTDNLILLTVKNKTVYFILWKIKYIKFMKVTVDISSLKP
jgi:hypothetical protein